MSIAAGPSSESMAAGDLSNEEQASGEHSDQEQDSEELSTYDPSELNNYLIALRQTSGAPVPPLESLEVIASHFLRLKEKMNSGGLLLDDINEFTNKINENIKELVALMRFIKKLSMEKKLRIDAVSQSIEELAREKQNAETDMEHLKCNAMSMELRLKNQDWLCNAKAEMDFLIAGLDLMVKQVIYLEGMANKAEEWYQITKKSVDVAKSLCNLL